jgi:phage capsid family|nr:MAG TPA: major capsid protein [Caudoviricetes sp.]DAK46150.1 MAG TPA: major capsid protein [Caudoviricetes sp.]DAK46375.1 MAG TPA: major capsid protein [Bacteriophage sp.]DAV40607.1 MAG TPA: major capsid protein [Caudoviricetes sp.]DAW47996.1 MAG TPA: major capsid protein [Caudoviricetes sp.]
MAINIKEFLEDVNTKRSAAVEAAKKEGLSPEKITESVKKYDMMKDMVGKLNKQNLSDKHFSIKETIMTTDVVDLVPRIIESKMIEAEDTQSVISPFFTKVQAGNTNGTVVVPIIGELQAHEVAEGGAYNDEAVEINTLEYNSIEVRPKKIGLKVTLSEEVIMDSYWDIMEANLSRIGGAMARYKDEWCAREFSEHGHVVFDNALAAQNPDAATTGLGEDSLPNNTLSVEDFMSMCLALMANDKTPTDVIMHPLCWLVFARNAMVGQGLTFGAMGAMNVNPFGTTQGTGGFAGLSNNMGPQQFVLNESQARFNLPMPINVILSPRVKFDKQNKTFDMYVIDRNNIGAIVQREDLSVEKWTNPEIDVRIIKAKERYGIGIMDNGKGIAVAKNISAMPSYPRPTVVRVTE